MPPVPEVPPSVFVLTHGGIACDPKSIWDTWRDAWTDSQQPETSLPCSKLTTSLDWRIIATHKWAAGMIRLPMTIRIDCLSSQAVFRLLLPSLHWCGWPGLGCVAKFCWQILATQHSSHFLLRIALSWQSYNTHQYLLSKIIQHDALKEW